MAAFARRGAARPEAYRKVPHGRWKTMTFLAALRCDRIEAPWFLEGPIDGDRFRVYAEKVLLLTLRPGDIVIMDKFGTERPGRASTHSRLFYLPKYSPDLNPSNRSLPSSTTFSERQPPELSKLFASPSPRALQLFAPEECANYLASSGYGRT
ncbi:hypothetical protein JOE51_004884 [Bradyrhizobium japonicum]|uniref:transposase n=1 Tax=Bradyrhizobium diazoefficiens TaxID=1355477 RepID=UPI001600452C|nr:hypothetical protein [Bradyrhizobium japonicum]